MCCDGTLFTWVPLPGEGDEATLVGTPITVQSSEGKAFFSQPCAAFAGCCSIYASRPSNCRSFRCSLLRRHEAGDVSTDEARRIIRMTLDMRDRALGPVRQLLAVDDMSFREIQKRLAELTAEEGDASPEHMVMVLDAVAADRLLSQHFLPTPPRDATTA
jgi:hypothetical protein